MISILCPTRKRPQNMENMVNSARELACYELEFVFYIDNDDPESKAMADKLGAKSIVGERIVLSEMWNKCYEESIGEIVMHCGDDIIFRTQDWDKLVTNEFNKWLDEIIFVYGRDGYSPDTFGTHGFIHRNWVKVLGYFVPPYFSSDMNDVWLNDVAKELGRYGEPRHIFLEDLYTEHMHPINGKGEWDITHQDRLARGEKDNVIQLYKDLEPQRMEDVKKLQHFISEFDKQQIRNVEGYDDYYFTGRKNAESYFNTHGQLHHVQDFAYRYILRHSKHKKVLDAGCGMGCLTFQMIQDGIDCVGLDPHTKDLFTREAQKRGIEARFIDGSLDKLPEEDFDTIVLCEAIEHITSEEWDRNEDKLVRILKKNKGTLIIVNVPWFHPIYPDNTGFDHVRTVDDVFYDHLASLGTVVLREGSHLVIKFK